MMDKGKGKEPLIYGGEEDEDDDYLKILMDQFNNNEPNTSSLFSPYNTYQNDNTPTDQSNSLLLSENQAFKFSSASALTSTSKGDTPMEDTAADDDDNGFFYRLLHDETLHHLALEESSGSQLPAENFVDKTFVVPPPQVVAAKPPKPPARVAATKSDKPRNLRKSTQMLLELAMHDPKRAKRIVTNRISAVKAKEKKRLYTSMLEQRSEKLFFQAAALKAQLDLLKIEMRDLTFENLSLREQTKLVKQRIELQDVLNEGITNEIKHLTIITETKPSQGLMINNNNNNTTTGIINSSSSSSSSSSPPPPPPPSSGISTNNMNLAIMNTVAPSTTDLPLSPDQQFLHYINQIPNPNLQVDDQLLNEKLTKPSQGLMFNNNNSTATGILTSSSSSVIPTMNTLAPATGLPLSTEQLLHYINQIPNPNPNPNLNQNPHLQVDDQLLNEGIGNEIMHLTILNKIEPSQGLMFNNNNNNSDTGILTPSSSSSSGISTNNMNLAITNTHPPATALPLSTEQLLHYINQVPMPNLNPNYQVDDQLLNGVQQMMNLGQQYQRQSLIQSAAEPEQQQVQQACNQFQQMVQYHHHQQQQQQQQYQDYPQQQQMIPYLQQKLQQQTYNSSNNFLGHHHQQQQKQEPVIPPYLQLQEPLNVNAEDPNLNVDASNLESYLHEVIKKLCKDM